MIRKKRQAAKPKRDMKKQYAVTNAGSGKVMYGRYDPLAGTAWIGAERRRLSKRTAGMLKTMPKGTIITGTAKTIYANRRTAKPQKKKQ